MKKILIEFFDEENINNCISQLYYNYDEIYYLYFPAQKQAYGIGPVFNALKEFNEKKLKLIPLFIKVKNGNTQEIISALDKICNTFDSFDFDITGGPEAFSYAVGKYVSENIPSNARVRYFDFVENKFIIVYPDFGSTDAELKRKLKVNELINLQASAVSNNLIRGGKKYRPDIFQNKYSENIVKIWNSVKRYPKEWNSFCGLRNENRQDLIKNYADSNDIILKHFGADTFTKYSQILSNLEKYGIIKVKNLSDKYITYKINLPEGQLDLMDKGGNIFEMYAYYVALSCGRYADCCVGVNVDWDGIVEEKPEEVNNEVDLILSNGYRSAFISCKNTEVTNACIYEIDTVARYYGGKYAKPVILSSVKAKPAIKNRAKESEIILIDDIANLAEDEFKRKLCEIL